MDWLHEARKIRAIIDAQPRGARLATMDREARRLRISSSQLRSRLAAAAWVESLDDEARAAAARLPAANCAVLRRWWDRERSQCEDLLRSEASTGPAHRLEAELRLAASSRGEEERLSLLALLSEHGTRHLVTCPRSARQKPPQIFVRKMRWSAAGGYWRRRRASVLALDDGKIRAAAIELPAGSSTALANRAPYLLLAAYAMRHVVEEVLVVCDTKEDGAFVEEIDLGPEFAVDEPTGVYVTFRLEPVPKEDADALAPDE